MNLKYPNRSYRLIPLVLCLLLCLSPLTACGQASETPDSAPPSGGGQAGKPVPTAGADTDTPLTGLPDHGLLTEDEEPVYLTCRIIDGAEDGNLLLAALDAPLFAGHEGLSDGRGVYRLALSEDTAVYLDEEPAGAEALEDGMPLEISFNGNILETFPAQLGEVYEVHGFSIGTHQNPGGGLYDLCGLYLRMLDDLWNRDPALNENITVAGLDLSREPGGLLESEKAALAWRFGELHGVEVVTGTFEELRDQGWLEASAISAPAPGEGDAADPKLYQWPDGCLFSIRPNEGHAEEVYSLPTLFLDVEKWKSPLAAYVLYDCSVGWPMEGTWSGYQIGSEMIS